MSGKCQDRQGSENEPRSVSHREEQGDSIGFNLVLILADEAPLLSRQALHADGMDVMVGV